MKANRVEQRKILLDRLETAMQNIYHNGTPTYPREFSPLVDFDTWLNDVAGFELEYLNEYEACTGETVPRQYRSKSGKTRQSLIMIDVNYLERLKNHGDICTYGRGGRTVAPKGWMHRDSIRNAEDMAENRTRAQIVSLIRLVENFNQYVTDWCKDVPNRYAEEVEHDTATAQDHLEMQPID